LPGGTIDAVVAGHFHQEVREFVQGVPVIQSRSRGFYFGRIDLYVDKATRRVDSRLTRIHEMQPICGTWFNGKESCDPRWANERIKEGGAKELFPLRTPE